MDTVDATTWQAVGITLSILGLLLSVLLWRRRGAASGLRGVGWSLLPAAAGLTGTLKLVWGIGNDIVHWAVRLVFSPLVWTGVVLAGISVALLAIAAAMRARGVGRRTPAARAPRGADPALPQERSRPRAEPHRGAGTAGSAGSAGSDKASRGQDEDMDDIEAILRKHGIS